MAGSGGSVKVVIAALVGLALLSLLPVGYKKFKARRGTASTLS